MFFRPNQFNVSSRRSSPRSLNFFTSGRFSSSARNSSSIQFPSRFGPISTKPEPASSRPCYHRHRDGATRPASPSRAQCYKNFYIRTFMNVCNKLEFLLLAHLSSQVQYWRVKPGAYPRKKIIAHSRLGWKGLPAANKLAYQKHL